MKQEELLAIFDEVKPLIKAYEKKGFTPKFDLQGKYDLWSIKDVFAFKKERKEVYFCGLTIQSNYVWFYYITLYSDPEVSKLLGKELMATLKGKSCFHLKKIDKIILWQIKDALKISFDLFKEKWRI